MMILGSLITTTNNLLSYAYHACQAELFPTRIRARAVGFVYSFSRVSTVFTSFMIAFHGGARTRSFRSPTCCDNRSTAAWRAPNTSTMRKGSLRTRLSGRCKPLGRMARS
jgi:hypothetical protein